MPRSASCASLLAPLFLLCASALPAAASDSAAPGLGLGPALSVGPFDAYATLHDGTRVVCDGVDVVHVDLLGQPLLHLGAFPAYVFPSFVLLAPDESFALVGESSNGDLVRFELDGSGQSTLGNVSFNYDALWEDPTHVLVSADTSGTFQNRIVRLDLATGQSTLVAQLDGPSGPLARRARTGELFVGLVDLAHVNNDSIVRFDATQLGSGQVLQLSDAALFTGALANVAALCLDQRYDVPGQDFWRLFVAIAPFGAPSTIASFAPGGARLADLVDSPDSISNLELVAGAGPGSCAAWQPDAGEVLQYRGTSFCFPSCSTAELRRLEPRRPQASIAGPGLGNPSGGSVTITLTGCVPNASVLLLVGPQALYSPTESTHVHPDGFLWHTGLALSPLRRLVTLPTDASGQASFRYVHNGSLNGTHAFQGLLRDGSGLFVGSSTCVLN